MKKLVFNLVIPLTVISFILFTKWWYVQVVDWVDEIMIGFPLPYTCPCFHTSICQQVFILELVADLITYFLFWLFVVLFVNRFIIKINPKKVVTIVLYAITILATSGYIFFFFFDHTLYARRDFEIKIIHTGYDFIWHDGRS